MKPTHKPSGEILAAITDGGLTTLRDGDPREVRVEPSIVNMTLADVLAMDWRIAIRCLNPECGHVAEPNMKELAIGFRRALGNTVSEIASRMFCKQCRGRRLQVWNLQGGSFSYYAAGGAEARDEAFRKWLAEVWAEADVDRKGGENDASGLDG